MSTPVSTSDAAVTDGDKADLSKSSVAATPSTAQYFHCDCTASLPHSHAFTHAVPCVECHRVSCVVSCVLCAVRCVSFSAQKRLAKQQAKDAEKAAKAEAKAAAKPAAAAASTSDKKRAGGAEEDDDVDPTQYFDQRVRELTEMRAAGKHRHLYPHKFHAALSIPQFQFEYKQLDIADGQRLDREVSVAGRVYNKRSSGASLYFYDLQGQGERVQIVADRKLESVSATRSHHTLGNARCSAFPPHSNRPLNARLSPRVSLLCVCAQERQGRLLHSRAHQARYAAAPLRSHCAPLLDCHHPLRRLLWPAVDDDNRSFTCRNDTCRASLYLHCLR